MNRKLRKAPPEVNPGGAFLYSPQTVSVCFCSVQQIVAEGLQGHFLVSGRHQDRNIVPASAIRNHADRNSVEGVENTRRKTALLPDDIAHNTDNTHIFIDFHIAEMVQLLADRRQMFRGVDRQRNGHFRGRNHIDRRFVPLKNFENFFQEPVSHQHSP